MEKRIERFSGLGEVKIYVLRRKSKNDVSAVPEPASVPPAPSLVPRPVIVQSVSWPSVKVKRLRPADIREYLEKLRRPADRVRCHGCVGRNGKEF